jgi:HSP90 family molecular chaperone
MTATFDKIGVGRPVWRKNWSLHSTEDLHQPTSIHEQVRPEDYWWRTERQTLTRSQEGEFLYFTIRNRAEPLVWIKENAQSALEFSKTLESFSPETIEYKGLQSDHQVIIDYLRS